MTQPNYIRNSSQFFGHYEVVTPQGVIPCHNLSTARSYIQGTREHAIVQQQSRNVTRGNIQPTVEVSGFCSPSGQYYAVAQLSVVDVRIDCHNSATLRGWLRDGVSPATLLEALQDASNIRRTGGWHG